MPGSVITYSQDIPRSLLKQHSQVLHTTGSHQISNTYLVQSTMVFSCDPYDDELSPHLCYFLSSLLWQNSGQEAMKEKGLIKV